MLFVPLLAPALLMAAQFAAAEAQIRAVGGRVTIQAEKMPLNQILDRLARSSGMKVTYEGARPSMLVTVTVDGISETEAILRLMEGQGISYVLATDSTGQRVDTLIISGAGAGRPAPPSQSAASSSEPAYEEAVPDYGHVPLDPAAIEAQGKPDPGSASGAAATGGFPNVPVDTGQLTQPSFPDGASFPTR